MPDLFPRFKDMFLDRACRAFEKRRKAISHHRVISVDSSHDSSIEWATLVVSCFNYPSLNLELIEGNHGNFYIRSNRATRRGKVLLRLEDLRLVDNASRLVETFEWTMSESHWLENDSGFDTERRDSIKRRWQNISMRIVR